MYSVKIRHTQIIFDGVCKPTRLFLYTYVVLHSMGYESTNHDISDEQRRNFLKALGLAGGAVLAGTAMEDLAMEDLAEAVTVDSADELAERGLKIRAGLTGELNAALLAEEMVGVTEAIERLSVVRAAGVPAMGETLYADLTESAWRIDRHLTEVGFYESAEIALPAFSTDHIETTTKQLIRSEAIGPVLSEVGFDEQVQLALLANVVGNVEHLTMWQPTWMLQDERVTEIRAEFVEPLHRRAAAGALNWIDGLDYFLAQRKLLITDEMLDAGLEDLRTMLGGFYLLSAAAAGIASGEVSDADLTALVTGGSGILITGQTDLQYDLVRITEEMRAPRTEA